MKEQYQKEVSQIHVPSELLEKTKQAMKEEEERLSKQKAGSKVISFRTVSLAAVAVLLLAVTLPMASSYLKTEQEAEIKSPKMQLSEKTEIEMGPIAKSEAKTVEVVTVDVMPKEFENAEEAEVTGKTVFLMKEETTGFWKAYCGERSLLITSKITEREEFLKELENCL